MLRGVVGRLPTLRGRFAAGGVGLVRPLLPLPTRGRGAMRWALGEWCALYAHPTGGAL